MVCLFADLSSLLAAVFGRDRFALQQPTQNSAAPASCLRRKFARMPERFATVIAIATATPWPRLKPRRCQPHVTRIA
jgi:hypothetical protein